MEALEVVEGQEDKQANNKMMMVREIAMYVRFE